MERDGMFCIVLWSFSLTDGFFFSLFFLSDTFAGIQRHLIMERDSWSNPSLIKYTIHSGPTRHGLTEYSSDIQCKSENRA